MKAYLPAVTLALLLLLSCDATAQGRFCDPGIQLVNATANREGGFVALNILARGSDCQPVTGLQAGDVRVTEKVGDDQEREVEIVRFLSSVTYDSLDMSREQVEVLFLVESADAARLSGSLDMIRTFLQRHRTANGTYRIQTFADQLGPSLPLDPQDPERVIGKLRASGGQPRLYASLLEALHQRDTISRKQLLFLFSTGRNVEADYSGRPRLPARPEDVFDAVETFGNALYLFTVANSGAVSDEEAGTGTYQGFLRQLPAKTPVADDGYAAGRLPEGVAAIFGADRRLVTTHTVEIKTADPVFTGRRRQYSLVETDLAEADTSYAFLTLGSFNDPVRLGEVREALSWFAPTLFGLLGIGGLLALFYFVVPQIRRYRFRSSHVVPYVSQPGRHVVDPMTREPIRNGEPVVNVCAMVVPLQTWKDCGDQCPHYPGCTNNNLQCSGAGRGQSLNFFALHGINRRLNWIWFGALGGFLGWTLYALLGGAGDTLISRIASNLEGYRNAETLLREAVIGACFGIGMTLMLAVMEERSQSRRISVRRILLRTLLGGVAATLAFGGGFLILESGLLDRPVWAAAISWMVFGVSLGLVLTVRSTIDRRRGVLGGLFSGIIGFLVYWLSQELLGGDLIPKVVSLLITGALLGLVLDTVVKLAENYEIEYVSPANYHRKVPLSKWLKNSWDIIVGTQPGSQVYIKWPDENVLPEHARIKLEGGRVFLYPQGETLVNGQIIHGQKRIQLQSGDMLQLGRRSQTQMRFWER